MGLFDKKYCDVCGEKIGMLGNRKLEDGNLCKNCASKLSPWFTGRRHSALVDIKYQLEDREANRAKVSAFSRSQKLGNDGCALYLDEAQGSFAVCYESDWKNGNPDILPLSAITNCRYESEEHRTEQKYKDANGKTVSYNPPVYDYSYDFYIIINVEHPYIDEIKFRVNNMTLKPNSSSLLSGGERKIIECEELCHQIVDRLINSSVPQNDLMLTIPQVMSPYRAKDPNGAYDMVVNLYVNGSVLVSVIDEAMFNENMAAEYIRNVISMTIMQLEREGTDIYAVNTALLDNRLMAAIGSNGLQQYGMEMKGTNLTAQIDPEHVKFMEKMVAAKKQLAAMNAAPAPESSEWVCPVCGGKNEGGKFCGNCASPRP